MCKDPIDPRRLEEAGQLGLFSHEPEPVEEDLEEEELAHLVNERCREELEEKVYRERILSWHPELEEEDLEEEEEDEDDSELEDIDELRERVELLERTGDFEAAVVLSALESGKSMGEARTDPKTRAKVLARLLDTILEVRLVLEAEGLIAPDSEPELVHDLIHGRARQ